MGGGHQQLFVSGTRHSGRGGGGRVAPVSTSRIHTASSQGERKAGDCIFPLSGCGRPKCALKLPLQRNSLI